MTEEEQGESIPEWVVTFGDMMSLLLTFFVLLFSMSEIKEDQQQALIQSLRRQFGHVSAMLSPIPGPAKPMSSAVQRISSMGRARRANTMNGGDKVRAPVGDYPPLRAARSGNETIIGGIVYFEEGRSDLTEESRKALESIAAVVVGKPQVIKISGHTGPRPLDGHSPYPNHWDLAYARCFSAMQTLVDLGIDRRRIRISVSASNEPADTNDQPLLEEPHDRVEVLLTDDFLQLPDAAEGNPDQPFTGPAL
jgi:chemotaxis protein MotB